MYREYVEVLARHSTEIFSEMTGTEVLGYNVKVDERLGETVPLAHIISYEHLDTPVKGNFILGFADQGMAVAVASALAEKMGLPPVEELDDIANDLLNEFMNTIVGHTISEWDLMGMPVKFDSPTSLKFSRVKLHDARSMNAYVVIIALAFSHIIFRVTFREGSTVISGNKKILVVEDSTVIRSIIASTLQQYGFNVQQAENGRKAQEIYRTFQPHLVLMDLVMPEMGGMEAMENIKKYDPKANFIVLTASSRRDEIMQSRKIGVKSYLTKPFNPDLLMREVNKIFTTPLVR